MKKTIYACILILCIGLLSACGKKTDVDVSTVIIEKKGKIVSVDLENLDKDYYDTEELEEYITKHIEDYTEANGKTVEMASFDAKEETARLEMKYNSYEDYMKFNGIELYVGTIVKAQADGYDFDTEFYGMTDSDTTKPATKNEVLSDDDNKVAIIRANVDVKVPGKVLYVSKQDTKITAKDTVSIMGIGANEEAALTYIIYK